MATSMLELCIDSVHWTLAGASSLPMQSGIPLIMHGTEVPQAPRLTAPPLLVRGARE